MEQSFFEETRELVEKYVKNRLRLFKLQAAERSSRIVTLLFTAIMIVVLLFFIVFFLSFMLAHFLGDIFHSLFWGYGIIALLYIIMLVVVVLMRKKLESWIFGLVIRVLFDPNADNDDIEA